jgi:hypothetical protein
MEQHALELLKLALWLIGGLGAIIAVLLGGIAAIARWGGVKLFERLDAHESKLGEFQKLVSNSTNDLKGLLTDEVRLLRESMSQISERVGKLEVFRDYMNHHVQYGRRHDDE